MERLVRAASSIHRSFDDLDVKMADHPPQIVDRTTAAGLVAIDMTPRVRLLLFLFVVLARLPTSARADEMPWIVVSRADLRVRP